MPVKKQHFQLIAGGRDFSDVEAVKNHIEWVKDFCEMKGRKLTIVSGGARGADTLAHEVATQLGITSVVIQAEWAAHPKNAGYLRNAQMAGYLVERMSKGHSADVVCFPGGVGTAHMRRCAGEMGLRVFNPRPVPVGA